MPRVMMFATIATLKRTLRGAFGVTSFLTLKKSIGSSVTNSLPWPTCSWLTDATFPSTRSTLFSRFDPGDGAASAESLSAVAISSESPKAALARPKAGESEQIRQTSNSGRKTHGRAYPGRK